MENVNGFSAAPPPLPTQQKKRSKAPIIIAVTVAAIVIIALMVLVTYGIFNAVGTDFGGSGLDIVYVEGTIAEDSSSGLFATDTGYGHNFIIDTIDALIENENSKGILVYINSPGGAIYQTDEVYFKLLEYKETGRPVYAYMAQTAASGGYYIACAADKIYCNRNTLTGSIGVIYGAFLDLSAFLENYGVKTHTFTSGDNKAMGSSYEPMTEEQKAIFQSIVDEAYEQFVDVVATGRKLDKSTVYPIADGRIYTAKQALSTGLVDEIASYEAALAAIKAELGDADMPVNSHIRTVSSPFGSLLGLFGAQSEAEVILDVLSAYNKTGYYCAELAQ